MAAFRVEAPPADEEPALVADINITPLVDVVLVLLIVFMVGSSAMVDAARQAPADRDRIALDLPSAEKAEAMAAEAPVVVLGLDKQGAIFVDGDATTGAALPDILGRKHREAPMSAVIIDADGAAPHRQVVKLLDAAQSAGFQNVGIGTAHHGGP